MYPIAVVGVLAVAASGCMARPEESNRITRPGPCIVSGTDAAINAALVGPGAEAVLCPNAVFMLANPVRFTAANQKIYTAGLPTDGTRAVLQVAASTLTTAIDGVDVSGVVVDSVQVDGARPKLGYRAGEALIALGGRASYQTVRGVAAFEPRSWSTLHLVEGGVTNGVPACQKATVVNNTIGPAGAAGGGEWADGISLACGHTLVEGNVIRDATDGAIVVFGAPSSTVRDNTILAETRGLLGGINMVDFEPVSGNYTNTLVTGNVIDARDAFIKVGIAMGPQVWNCTTGTNFGATVTGNTLRGAHMGYGFAVNGVRDWTVTGNLDESHHVGTVTGGCGGATSPPGGFQAQAATSSTLQPEFATGARLTYVLGVFEPVGAASEPFGCSNIYAGQSIRVGRSVGSCDGRFRLMVTTSGRLTLLQGEVELWSAGPSGGTGAVATMRPDGHLVLVDGSGRVVWDSGTASPGAHVQVQDDGNLVIVDLDNRPLWASETCCH